MNGPLYATDLDDVLDTLAEIEDDDLNLIITGLRNIARRATLGRLDLNTTQVLIAALAASPDSTDLIGACAYTVTEITEHNPALDLLPEDDRKEAVKEGQEAVCRLNDQYLRNPASRACAFLDYRKAVRP